MNILFTGILWLLLYLAVVTLPLFLMLVPPVPTGRGFWLELSVAFGFVGLTQIVVQLILTSRFKSLSAPYGIDIILRFHRQIALVAIGFILIHPVLIIVDTPSRVKLLNPLGGTWASKTAWMSLFCLVGLAVTSLFRVHLGLSYERWRLFHLVLAGGAVIFALLHVVMAGLYTNALWKHGVWVLPGVGLILLVLYTRVIKPGFFPDSIWRVAEVRPERGNCVTLVLEADGHAGMKFEPGQFAWVTLGDRKFTMQENPFSNRSSAARPGRLEFGIKKMGDFTNNLPNVKPGTRAVLQGPHGAFSIDRYPAVGYVFIAGGIGVTPLMSFLHTMADRGDPRPVILVYADKTLEDMAFQEELAELEKALDLKVVYVPEKAGEDWQGETGLVTWDILERHVPRDLIHREFFLCGPAPMMASLQKALRAAGVQQDHIHLELFDLV